MIQRTLGVGLMLMLLIGGNWANVPMGQAQAGTETIHLAGETATLPDVQVQLTSEPINNPGTDLQTENLYQGPVTFSVVFGQSVDAYNEINGLGPVKDYLPVERNGITQSATRSNFHNVRLFIRLEWPGMDQADSHIQDVVRKGRTTEVSLVGVALKEFLEANDGYLGEITYYSFDSAHGGWIQDGLPDGVQQIWVQPVRKADENTTSEPAIEGKWQVALYDVTPHRGHILSNDCPAASCLPGEFLTQLNSQVKADGVVPVMCPDQAAAGVSIQKAWIETRPVWWDTTRWLGFEPALNIPGQERIIVAIHAEPSLPSYTIVFPSSGGSFQSFSLSLSSLYDDSSRNVTVDSATSTLRSAQHGLVLEGHIPEGAALEQAFLVQIPTGPVWRLSCAGK